MAGTIVADTLRADSTSTLVLRNGVANTPPTIQDNNGTQIGTFCRAWVNFNGTGTVAIRASFNVSSITDNGTGDYTVNFTNAMPDVNYTMIGQCGTIVGGGASQSSIISDYLTSGPVYARTASGVRFFASSGSLSQFDNFSVNVAIFR
jgi:hypothetical protein